MFRRHVFRQRQRAATAFVGVMGLLAGLLTSSAGAQTAFVGNFQQVVERLDLGNGETALLVDVDLNLQALAWSPENRLWAVSREVVTDPSAGPPTFLPLLHRIDLETLALETIDVLPGVAIPQDLAVDDDELWLIADGVLFSVDKATAATQEIGGAGLQSVAVWQDQLWGIQRLGGSGWEMVSLDPSDGTATVVGPLAELDMYADVRTKLDFDIDGNAWVLVLLVPGIPLEPQVMVYRLDGIDTQTFTRVWDFGNSSRNGFAVARSRQAVEIPVLGSRGILFLAMLLGSGAVVLMRRRTAAAVRR